MKLNENLRIIKDPKKPYECVARYIFENNGIRLGRTRRVVTRDVGAGEHCSEEL